MEIWEPIIGYEDYYSVSNLGRIMRTKGGQNRTYPGKILKPCKNPQGYLRVDLHKNNKREQFTVHKLVTTAFLGPCPEGKEVNHKDSDRANAHLDNLEYVTRSENTLHAYKNGRGPNNKGSKSGLSKLTEADVLYIRELFKIKFMTRKHLAKVFNIDCSTISDILRRKTWRHI